MIHKVRGFVCLFVCLGSTYSGDVWTIRYVPSFMYTFKNCCAADCVDQRIDRVDQSILRSAKGDQTMGRRRGWCQICAYYFGEEGERKEGVGGRR